MKIRIGMAYDKETNETLYQLQFMFPNENRYKGYSYDMFKTRKDAQKALILHVNGKREYKYETNIEKEKRTIKGNKVTLSKVLFCHILVASSDLPESIIWFKSKNN